MREDVSLRLPRISADSKGTAAPYPQYHKSTRAQDHHLPARETLEHTLADLTMGLALTAPGRSKLQKRPDGGRTDAQRDEGQRV